MVFHVPALKAAFRFMEIDVWNPSSTLNQVGRSSNTQILAGHLPLFGDVQSPINSGRMASVNGDGAVFFWQRIQEKLPHEPFTNCYWIVAIPGGRASDPRNFGTKPEADALGALLERVERGGMGRLGVGVCAPAPRHPPDRRFRESADRSRQTPLSPAAQFTLRGGAFSGGHDGGFQHLPEWLWL
jgi:hypothetical protein